MESGMSVKVAREGITPVRDESPAALRLEGITKRWDPARPPVLDDVSLELRPGTVVGIDGVNGAGKTTLLRIAAGLIMPDTGTVRAFGLDPESDRTGFHRRVGFVTAGNSGLYGRLRVEHHLDLVAKLSLLPRQQRREVQERALETFGLRDLCGRRVDRLSMGQRQRLRLALGLLHDPDVVLLDEPLSSLDDEGAHLVADQLDKVRRRSGAAIVCAPTGDERSLPFDSHFTIEHGRVTST
jgi:ABC-type multidrug transport system ATPase subunit